VVPRVPLEASEMSSLSSSGSSGEYESGSSESESESQSQSQSRSEPESESGSGSEERSGDASAARSLDDDECAWEALGGVSGQSALLPSWLCAACRGLGLERPTAIQRTAIPAVFAGDDVVAAAPTGSGKTAAFALPMLTALARDPYGVFALVLTPTRELASQIIDVFNGLASGTGRVSSAAAHASSGRRQGMGGFLGGGFRALCCTGGRDMVIQASELQRRPHVVVATPGRLVDHIRTNRLQNVLSRVQFVVLDEADRLLENPGLRADVETIFKTIPGLRRRTEGPASGNPDAGERRPPGPPQVLLFSATMTLDAAALRQIGIFNPKRFSTADRTLETARNLEQEYMYMSTRLRDCYLTYVMRLQELDDDDDGDHDDDRGRGRSKRSHGEMTAPRLGTTVIIFGPTCRQVQLIHEMLKRLGIHSAPLHSELTMSDRIVAIDAFKSGSVQVLVATDVAGRGLDIPAVGLVINYNVPKDPSDYVHRVGRTARAGRSGKSITLVTQHDVDRVHAIEEKIGRQLDTAEIDEELVLRHLNETTTARTLAEVHLRDKNFGERRETWEKKRQQAEAAARRSAKRQKS
jgi:ATP-dependent RNA helicase DDX49/DBP8